MAMGVAALTKKEVHRIILTRPAVEAGEKLGFLPGDLLEKVNPYLRPLYDALHDMMDFETGSRLIEKGIIEVAPLAFMRGRTLNDSFVILDEAQNTTSEQMKMFLTRLGFGSKAVITGDITQIDLPAGKNFRAGGGPGDPDRESRGSISPISRKRTSCATPWFRISSGPMKALGRGRVPTGPRAGKKEQNRPAEKTVTRNTAGNGGFWKWLSVEKFFPRKGRKGTSAPLPLEGVCREEPLEKGRAFSCSWLRSWVCSFRRRPWGRAFW